MWPHMKITSRRPLALCAKSSRAGQRLLRARSASPAPAMIWVLESMHRLRLPMSCRGGQLPVARASAQKPPYLGRDASVAPRRCSRTIDLHQESRRRGLRGGGRYMDNGHSQPPHFCRAICRCAAHAKTPIPDDAQVSGPKVADAIAETISTCRPELICAHPVKTHACILDTLRAMAMAARSQIATSIDVESDPPRCRWRSEPRRAGARTYTVDRGQWTAVDGRSRLRRSGSWPADRDDRQRLRR